MTNCLGIFGFGYTARFLAELCNKDDIALLGVSRNHDKPSVGPTPDYTPLPFSASALAQQRIQPTHILVSTPPTETGDPTLNEFKNTLARQASTIQSIGYLSTTGVYGDHQGEWVDELSSSNNPGHRACMRLAAERSWIDFAKQHNVPLYIFRIAGIYGPYRNALSKLNKGMTTSILKEKQVFSRIHVLDLANAIKTALFQPENAGIYNICDNEPASNIVVDQFAATLLGIDPPRIIPIEQADLSPMAKEFYQANKRVSNAKLRATFKLSLAYPSFQEGLLDIFNKKQF
tara:strand:+ start:800 stop:1666 length:867 start_codon:yes stop_codon:yes gene_type:complete